MYPIVGSLGSYFRSSVKNMFCENIKMYFLQGSLHWSKGGGEAPDPHDISRKLFQKFCKEYVLREI